MFKFIYKKIRWNLFWNNFKIPEISLHDLGAPDQIIELPIKDHLFLPPYFGTNDHDDASALFNLVMSNNPRVVLELGTAYGTTVANICALTQSKVITINALPEQISGKITSTVLTRDQIGFVYRKHGFENRVTQIYENTRNLVITDHIPTNNVDFVIIDACHDIDYVIKDFLLVLPVIHEHSIIMFHDVHPSLEGHLVSSYIAGMYLRKMGYNIRHIKDTWWAVWQASYPKQKVTLIQKAVIMLDKWLTELLMIRYRNQKDFEDAIYMNWIATSYFSKVKPEIGGKK